VISMWPKCRHSSSNLTRIGESMRYKRFWRLTAYWNFRGFALELVSRNPYGRITPLFAWLKAKPVERTLDRSAGQT
jgi:hypothetical protein